MLTFNFSEPAVIDTARRGAIKAPRLTAEQRRAAEKRMFLRKAKARSIRNAARKESTARGFAKALAAQRLKISRQSPQLRKAAGITPQVERLAAEGNKQAQAFLKAAEARVSGAVSNIQRAAQPVFRIIKTKFGKGITTDKFGRKTFQEGLAFAAGGSAGVSQFRIRFAKETRALESAKGAASGESRKAGLETGGTGFLSPTPTGTTFKRTVFDSVGISESGGVKQFTETKQPLGKGRVGPSSEVLGGTVTKGKVGVLDFVGGGFTIC